MSQDVPEGEAAPRGSRASAAAGAGHGAGRAKYLRAKDLATLAKLPVGALLAWTLPEPAWDRVAAAGLRGLGGAPAGELERLRTFVRGDELGVPVEDIVLRYERNLRLVQAQYLRCHHPRGWRPDIRLEGREHLDRALGAGRGAIVWKAPFLFSSLPTAMALHAAGYELVALARPEHGYSPTRFGVRVLNPVITRAEDRHLAERVVIGQVPLQEAMRMLVRRLAENKVVFIVVSAQGRRTCVGPFLRGELRVATGVPNLALRTGAPVLPVFTIREGPGRFRTVVEPPLEARAHAGREQVARDLVAAVAARIEHHARCWPDQFAWRDFVTDREPSAG